MSLDTAARLAQVLEVSLDQLVTGSEPPPPPLFKNARLLGQELEELGKRLGR